MIRCNDRYVLLFCLIAFIENGNPTSIMNAVNIGNNELRPPTILNITTHINNTTHNKTIKMPSTPNFTVSNRYNGNYSE